MLKCINKLNRASEVISEIGHTTECHGYLGCNATQPLPVLSSGSFIESSFLKVIGRISTDCCFGPFCIIETSGEYHSTCLCTWVLYFLCFVLLCCIKSTSLAAVDSSDIFLSYFWSDSK